MNLKELKNWVNSLSEDDLKKSLLYNSIDYGISGEVSEITKTDDDLYFVGDDPVLLHTRQELKQRGFSDQEIDELDVEIPQGCFYIELSNEYSIIDRFLH